MEEKIGKKDLTWIMLVAVLGIAVYLFIFPTGAISTFMHQVLLLPGPGAGIGFILGPAIIACSLFAYTLIRKQGVALITGVIFGFMRVIFALEPAEGTLGTAGSAIKILTSVAVLAVLLELSLLAFQKRKLIYRFIISAVVSDLAYIVYYWIAIFPSTKGWVLPKDVPVLVLTTVIGAVLFGVLLPVLILKMAKKF